MTSSRGGRGSPGAVPARGEERPISASRRASLRRLLGIAAGGAASLHVGPVRSASVSGVEGATGGDPARVQRRPIPSSGRSVPCIGMGTWITFDLPPGHPERAARVEVMRRLLAAEDAVVDSSPMYGHAEELVGHALAALPDAPSSPFAASKIWTPLVLRASTQMDNTERLWGVRPMDLVQVHNLVEWREHLPRLREWQREGRIRHVGVTTSHGRRHAELEALLEREAGDGRLDFVQLTYNARDREAEARLLPLARERGVAVIANRPLQRGALVRDNARRPLPSIAASLGCTSWAQLCLLYAVSHPDITCVIPATGVPAHLDENLAVGRLPMPDAATRRELLAAIA